MTLTHYLAVGLGGATGAILRVLMGKLLPFTVMGIPMHILIVNIAGCFMMGLIAELLALYWSASDKLRAFLIPGMLGGFTTFSAFALEFGLLFEKHAYLTATLYVMLSVGLSLVFFFLGILLVRTYHF